MRIEDYIDADLLERFEFYSYNHAIEIITQAFPDEWSDVVDCLRKLNILTNDLRESGGNETNIPKKFDDVLYPYGWREIRISGDLIVKKYPRQSRAIQKELKALARYEKENTAEIDKPAGCFGRLMAELFVYKKDRWEETLRRMAFYLGKFIYIMDACDDLEKDLQSGSYNPLRGIAAEKDYEERCRQMLCMMMGECTAEFEKLPLVLDIDILRNILYDGVWKRYRKLYEQKSEESRS